MAETLKNFVNVFKCTVALLDQKMVLLFTSHDSSTALMFLLTKVKREMIQTIQTYTLVILHYNCPLLLN